MSVGAECVYLCVCVFVRVYARNVPHFAVSSYSIRSREPIAVSLAQTGLSVGLTLAY